MSIVERNRKKFHKINLYGHYNVINEGWENSWKGGLESADKINTLEDYFNVKYMNDMESLDFYGTEIKPLRTIHVEDVKRVKPSFGLTFMGEKKSVFITGDSQFTPELFEMDYHRADIIFQDCDFNKYEGGVHAQFHELCTLPKEIKSKMWLYHYALGDAHIWEFDVLAKDNGFEGVVRRGQKFKV